MTGFDPFPPPPRPKAKKGGRPSKIELANRSYEESLAADKTLLTGEQVEYAMEHILSLKSIDQLWKQIGFRNRVAFHNYIKRHPEFEKRLDEARLGSCRFIEDEIMFITDGRDAKQASVKLNALLKLLQFYDPKKYGPKLDVNMQQTISIRANLDAANSRMQSLMKDVTSPAEQIIEQKKEEKPKDDVCPPDYEEFDTPFGKMRYPKQQTPMLDETILLTKIHEPENDGEESNE